MIQSTPASIPVLETERLRLRGHTITDFESCSALWSNKDVVRYIGPPATSEECWTRLLRYRGHWALMNYGCWLVEDKHSNEFVGEVGYMKFHRDIAPALINTPEMGWVLMPQMHGQGYASEAVTAAQNWGDAYFGSINSLCIIHPENLPSLRLAQNAGFGDPVKTTYKDMPALILKRGTVGLQ